MMQSMTYARTHAHTHAQARTQRHTHTHTHTGTHTETHHTQVRTQRHTYPHKHTHTLTGNRMYPRIHNGDFTVAVCCSWSDARRHGSEHEEPGDHGLQEERDARPHCDRRRWWVAAPLSDCHSHSHSRGCVTVSSKGHGLQQLTCIQLF